MLHVLFDDIHPERRADEAAMVKLAQCADVFEPDVTRLGARSIWRPVPMHPIALAMAIKQFRRTDVRTKRSRLREPLSKIAKECERLDLALMNG